ncbi:MAG: hypothetical protein IJ679_00765 [Lachnospiraceae bacterium]|nr:hypothetical protein [Lachnospiraceae bacterium]
MANKVYPDWVQKQKTRGTTVKKVGSNYYLYKHSSKRIPGKKNPVPSDTYIGRITPEGIITSSNKKVDANASDIIVREYGFSRAIQHLCPASWKEPLGDLWQEVLDFIIVRESPGSYIIDEREVPKELDPHIQLGAQKSALLRRMKQEYGRDLKDIRCLSSIYLVTIGKKHLISKISDEQKALIDDIGLVMEVH